MKKISTAQIAKMAMLVAISVVLVAIVHVPLIPAVSFLVYDPADIPILIGTFAFGPTCGFVLTVVTSVIQGFTVSAEGSYYGIIMHIIATGALVLVSGCIYKCGKTKKRALLALALGTLAMAAIMVPANLVVTPLFTGWPVSAVKEVLPGIIGFNLLKAGINSAVTFLVYKRISPFLHKQ